MRGGINRPETQIKREIETRRNGGRDRKREEKKRCSVDGKRHERNSKRGGIGTNTDVEMDVVVCVETDFVYARVFRCTNQVNTGKLI